jgi:hypothetical protein
MAFLLAASSLALAGPSEVFASGTVLSATYGSNVNPGLSAGAISIDGQYWTRSFTKSDNGTGIWTDNKEFTDTTGSPILDSTGVAVAVRNQWSRTSGRQGGNNNQNGTTGNFQLTEGWWTARTAPYANSPWDNAGSSGRGSWVAFTGIDSLEGGNVWAYDAYIIVSDNAVSAWQQAISVNGTWYWGTANGTEQCLQSVTWQSKGYTDDAVLTEGLHGSYLRVTNLSNDKLVAQLSGANGKIAGIAGLQLQTYALLNWTGGASGAWDAATSANWTRDGGNHGASAQTWGVLASNVGGRVAVFESDATVTLANAETQNVDGFWIKTGGDVVVNGSGNLTLGHSSTADSDMDKVAKFVIEANASLHLVPGILGNDRESIIKSGGGELLIGNSTIANLVTVEEGTFGVISNGTYATTLTLSSGLDMVYGGTLKVVLGGDGTDTTLDLNGVNSALDGVTLEVEGSGRLIVTGVHNANHADVNAWAAAVGLAPGLGTWNDGTYVATIAAIPEPSTYALFGGVGALALALLRRKRKA